MRQDRSKGADASDARQSRRKELIAVRRRVPEGLAGPGALQRPALGGEEKTYTGKIKARGKLRRGEEKTSHEEVKERNCEQTRVN
jgi:hypothetical protein